MLGPSESQVCTLGSTGEETGRKIMKEIAGKPSKIPNHTTTTSSNNINNSSRSSSRRTRKNGRKGRRNRSSSGRHGVGGGAKRSHSNRCLRDARRKFQRCVLPLSSSLRRKEACLAEGGAASRFHMWATRERMMGGWWADRLEPKNHSRSPSASQRSMKGKGGG